MPTMSDNRREIAQAEEATRRAAKASAATRQVVLSIRNLVLAEARTNLSHDLIADPLE